MTTASLNVGVFLLGVVGIIPACVSACTDTSPVKVQTAAVAPAEVHKHDPFSLHYTDGADCYLFDIADLECVRCDTNEGPAISCVRSYQSEFDLRTGVVPR